MTKDFKVLLASAKLAERTVPVCLRGDLVADFEAADRALTEAQKQPSTSKEGSGVAELLDRVEQLQAEMRDSTYEFRMRAMDRIKFRGLMAAHPPRRLDDGELDPTDAQLGFDRDAFFEALLKATTIDPVLSDDEWSELLAKITDSQYGALTDGAWYANRSDVIVPFSRAASLARRNSADE